MDFGRYEVYDEFKLITYTDITILIYKIHLSTMFVEINIGIGKPWSIDTTLANWSKDQKSSFCLTALNPSSCPPSCVSPNRCLPLSLDLSISLLIKLLYCLSQSGETLWDWESKSHRSKQLSKKDDRHNKTHYRRK